MFVLLPSFGLRGLGHDAVNGDGICVPIGVKRLASAASRHYMRISGSKATALAVVTNDMDLCPYAEGELLGVCVVLPTRRWDTSPSAIRYHIILWECLMVNSRTLKEFASYGRMHAWLAVPAPSPGLSCACFFRFILSFLSVFSFCLFFLSCTVLFTVRSSHSLRFLSRSTTGSRGTGRTRPRLWATSARRWRQKPAGAAPPLEGEFKSKSWPHQ